MSAVPFRKSTGFCDNMRNVSVIPLLRQTLPVSVPMDVQGHAPLPNPLPLVIGILVGAQVIILLSILVYVVRCVKTSEKQSPLYGEIGRSPPIPRLHFWARLKARIARSGRDQPKSDRYINHDSEGFLEKLRMSKRGVAFQQHMRTMSNPVQFTIPTKPEELVRLKASERPRVFPMPPIKKPSVEPWISPKRRRPVLTSTMRSRSLQTEDKKANTDRTKVRVSRSKSMPTNLGQAAEAWSAETAQEKPEACMTAIGEIEPGLYRVDEQHEMYTPSKFGLGKLSFSLFYDAHEAQMTVYLIQAVQLPARTERATADTFVKISLLPDEERRSASSKVQRRTLNPIYRQNFIFRLPEEDVADTVIKLTVIGLDRYCHPVYIGEVMYPLSVHDFQSSTSDVSEPIWRDIEKTDSPEEPRQGDLLFSLTYLPNAERVTVVILKARNLHLPESEETEHKKHVMDTFVKVTVVRENKVVKNKQTSVVRRNSNPAFNEAFTVDLSCEDEQVCLVFAVCLRINPFAGHKTLGRCTVGPDTKATGNGAAHWKDMMTTPRSAIAAWHPLK